jgi:DNA-binding transcriptional MerR regulator
MNKRVGEGEITELLGVSPRTVRNWRSSRIIPFTKINRVILYYPLSVEQALLKFERKAHG